MSNTAMREKPAVFFLVPDCFKTEETCIKAVEKDPWFLAGVPNHFKIQEICNNAVPEDPYSLQYVPDWFVTQEQEPSLGVLLSFLRT